MSVFLKTNHLFLRSPDAEGVRNMKEAGFGAIFLNVKDYPLDDWKPLRDEAAREQVVCGPWSRTCTGDPGSVFDPELLLTLIQVAREWGDVAYIVNAEDEIDGSGKELTTYIQETCADDEWALSTLPWPFNDVDWSPIKVPVLPQVFGAQWSKDYPDCKTEWHARGVACVVPTFGTYSGWTPDLYDLLTPYGLYTADDCLGNYGAWKATGTTDPCVPGGRTMIGSQDGIKASVNALRDLDPSKTLLVKQGKEWPDISTLPADVSKWKAWDKLQRTLQILKDDHDGGI